MAEAGELKDIDGTSDPDSDALTVNNAGVAVGYFGSTMMSTRAIRMPLSSPMVR